MPKTGPHHSDLSTAHRERAKPSIDQIVRHVGTYHADAFAFVQAALTITADRIYGPYDGTQPHRHVTGQEICYVLRELALARWGKLAGLVLSQWHVRSTLDFGKIVYALIDAGLLHKRSTDSLRDFTDVYDFESLSV